jgi:hypothetical protein
MEQQAAAFQRAAEGDARLRPMPGNELLDYLKCLTADELVQLTDCASEDVLEAMNAFVQRLMGEGSPPPGPGGWVCPLVLLGSGGGRGRFSLPFIPCGVLVPLRWGREACDGGTTCTRENTSQTAAGAEPASAVPGKLPSSRPLLAWLRSTHAPTHPGLPGTCAGMEEEAWQGGMSDCTAEELSQLMYWLLITGYELRSLEQRLNLTRTLDLPPPDREPPSLPPGRLQ